MKTWDWECYCGESNGTKQEKCRTCGAAKDAFKAKNTCEEVVFKVRDVPDHIDIDEILSEANTIHVLEGE